MIIFVQPSENNPRFTPLYADFKASLMNMIEFIDMRKDHIPYTYI